VDDHDPRGFVARLARATLSPDAGCDPIRLDEVGRPFFEYLAGHQLDGVAVAAADSGILVLSDRQRALLDRSLRDAMVWALAIERRLLSIAQRFDDQKIEFIVLKGPAVAHSAYADPAQRPFRDLDLLVRARDWDRARAALEQLGFERERPEPRRGFDLRFGKAAVHTDPTGIPVDLHHRIVLGPFGLWIDSDALFDTTASLHIAGYPLRRLDDTGLVLHACVHAALGWRPPLPLTLWDVAQTAWLPEVRWAQLEDLAGRWRLEGVLQFAFGSVRGPGFGAALPPETRAFDGATPPRRERKALSSYVTSRRTRGGMSLATMSAIPRIRDRVRYAVTLLIPSRAFMEWRRSTGDGGSYVRRWALPLSWPRRRDANSRRSEVTGASDPQTGRFGPPISRQHG